MLNGVSKYQKSKESNYRFSILIPTWNNLPYLKLCIQSIQKNSHANAQIIIIINEGKDGTLEWVQNQKEIDYVISKENMGICYGLNIARSLIKSEYVLYMNDDMYALPGWDTELLKDIGQIGHKNFMLSATMIEPFDTGNPCVIVKDYGTDAEHFREIELLENYSLLVRPDWSGSTWPPNIVHVDMWDLVGGLSIEYHPGTYSDPDFSRKLYEAGVRLFKGNGKSLVYHFGSKSTRRIKKNRGRKIFLMKWGITPNVFAKQYLKMGQSFFGELKLEEKNLSNSLVNKLKRFLTAGNKYLIF